MKLLVLLIVVLSTTAQAKIYRAQYEAGIQAPYDERCNYRQTPAPTIKRGMQSVDFEIEPNEKTLTIKTGLLATGNCIGSELPQVLQLQEGEVLETAVYPSGVPAMSRSKDTVFYARWDRPMKNMIRVYGGCSWAYTCGGMTGHSSIQFNITEP